MIASSALFVNGDGGFRARRVSRFSVLAGGGLGYGGGRASLLLYELRRASWILSACAALSACAVLLLTFSLRRSQAPSRHIGQAI